MGIPYTSEEFFERVKKGDKEIVELFLLAGMDPNTRDKQGVPALAIAAMIGHTGIVKALVKKDAQIDARFNMSQPEEMTDATALIFSGNVDIIKILLKNGADVNAKTREGLTVLATASRFGDLVVISHLLEKGAETSKQTCTFALYFAVNSGNIEIVKFFLNKGGGH